MTRRDYILLSDALRDAQKVAQGYPASATVRQGVTIATEAIADALKAKNPGGFDKPRFMGDSNA